MLFLFYPGDGLVRADHLARAAECPPIQVSEPAVCAPLGTVEFGEHYPSPVCSLSGLEYPVGTDQGTEVATLAPVLIYLQSHGMVLCMLSGLFMKLFVCFAGDISKEVISMRIDADNKGKRIELNNPDRLSHTEFLKKNAFQGHF